MTLFTRNQGWVYSSPFFEEEAMNRVWIVYAAYSDGCQQTIAIFTNSGAAQLARETWQKNARASSSDVIYRVAAMPLFATYKSCEEYENSSSE